MTALSPVLFVWKGQNFMKIKRNEKGQFVKGNVKDITGQRFSHLVVLGLDHIENKKSYWLCQCDCGNQKVIRSDCLKVIQSCGCVKKEQDLINLGITNNHHMTNHPAFRIWNAMMNRCMSPNNAHYKDYGGRGITVCDEWKNPINFCKWADDNGFIPNTDLSIERIDVNGNYEPSNCKWIPKSEQRFNKRNTVKFIDDDGVEKSVAKEATLRGVNPSTASSRRLRGIKDPRYIFHKGNLQKDFPSIFGGFLSEVFRNG